MFADPVGAFAAPIGALSRAGQREREVCSRDDRLTSCDRSRGQAQFPGGHIVPGGVGLLMACSLAHIQWLMSHVPTWAWDDSSLLESSGPRPRWDPSRRLHAHRDPAGLK